MIKNSICPICALVVVTWVLGLTGIYLNQPWANAVIVAILMGASLGAVAEKYGRKFGFVWKVLVVLFGAPAIYFLIIKSALIGLGLVLVMALFTIFLHRSKQAKFDKEDLFKDCC